MQPPLDRLAELLPPPPEPPAIDWPSAEAELGTTLPPDYKAFCDRWGFGDLQTSGPLSVYRLPDEAATSQGILAEEVQDELMPPVALFPEPGGLLLWGETESEARLLWRTATRPEDWEVVVLHGEEPVATGVGFAPWLVGALERRLPEGHVPPELRPAALEQPWRWVPRDPDDDQYDTTPRAQDVIAGHGSEEFDGRLTPMVELDFGGLEPPRGARLDEFVAELEPPLRAAVVGTRVAGSIDIVYLRDAAATEAIMRAALDFAAARLGVRSDPRVIDDLLGWT